MIGVLVGEYQLIVADFDDNYCTEAGIAVHAGEVRDVSITADDRDEDLTLAQNSAEALSKTERGSAPLAAARLDRAFHCRVDRRVRRQQCMGRRCDQAGREGRREQRGLAYRGWCRHDPCG